MTAQDFFTVMMFEMLRGILIYYNVQSSKKAFKMGGFEETTSSSMIAHFDNYIKKEVVKADEVYLNP